MLALINLESSPRSNNIETLKGYSTNTNTPLRRRYIPGSKKEDLNIPINVNAKNITQKFKLSNKTLDKAKISDNNSLSKEEIKQSFQL